VRCLRGRRPEPPLGLAAAGRCGRIARRVPQDGPKSQCGHRALQAFGLRAQGRFETGHRARGRFETGRAAP